MDKNFNSLIQATKGIESSFTKLRFVTLSCLVCTFLCALGCVIYSINAISDMGNKVYVIDNMGNALSAVREDGQVSRELEVEAQAKNLHRLLFNVVPNKEIVQKQLEEALEISDRSVYNYYNTLAEKDFYKNMFLAGANQWFQLDSIKTDIRRQPYPVITYGTLWTMRESNLTKSLFVSRCQMVEVDRNSKNLNGLRVEKFEVMQNTVIDSRQR